MAASIHGNSLNKTVVIYVVNDVLGDITMYTNFLTCFLKFEKRRSNRIYVKMLSGLKFEIEINRFFIIIFFFVYIYKLQSLIKAVSALFWFGFRY